MTFILTFMESIQKALIKVWQGFYAIFFTGDADGLT